MYLILKAQKFFKMKLCINDFAFAQLHLYIMRSLSLHQGPFYFKLQKNMEIRLITKAIWHLRNYSEVTLFHILQIGKEEKSWIQTQITTKSKSYFLSYGQDLTKIS